MQMPGVASGLAWASQLDAESLSGYEGFCWGVEALGRVLKDLYRYVEITEGLRLSRICSCVAGEEHGSVMWMTGLCTMLSSLVSWALMAHFIQTC